MNVADSTKKDLETIRPVPKMYTSKRTGRARPPSLVYTSPVSMQFIKDHDKDADVNFEEETRKTRSRSKNKNDKSVSEKRKAPKAPVSSTKRGKKVNLKERKRIEDSESEIELEDGDFVPEPRPGEVGKKDKPLPILEGREGFVCPKCGLKHADPLDPLPEESKWVYCPVCQVVIHTTCISQGCVCKYRPLRRHLD